MSGISVLCDRCGEVNATVECIECKVPFCSQCDQTVHRRGKWASHSRSSLAEEGTESSIYYDAQEISQKRERMRANVLRELVKTEEDYVNDLRNFVRLYVEPMCSGKFPELNRNPKVDVTILFSTVKEFIPVHDEIYRDFQEELKKSEPMFGMVLSKKLSNLPMYSVYCNHQDETIDFVANLTKSSPHLKEFLENTKQSDSRQLGFFDYLIKPFQRITKYPLLLKVMFFQG